MRIDNSKKLILLLLDGFGMSTSWQNNAILSAKRENLDKLFTHFQNKVLLSPIPRNSSRLTAIARAQASYSYIGSGKLDDDDVAGYADKIIEGHLTGHVLSDTLKRSADHLAALHLIGLLPSPGSDEFDLLLSLIKVARRQRVQTVKIHFIIDNSFHDMAETGAALRQIENNLSEINLGEITTFVGLSQLSNDISENSAFKNIIFGSGNHYISSDQFISSLQGTIPIETMPSIIRRTRGNNIANFDSVVFFSKSPFLDSVVDNFIRIPKFAERVIRPFYLSKLSIFDSPKVNFEHIPVVFENDRSKHINNILKEKGFSQLAIASDLLCRSIKYYFGENENDRFIPIRSNVDEKNYGDDITNQYIQEISDQIHKKNFNLMKIASPILINVCQSGSFKKIVNSVEEADKFIGRVATLALKENIPLLLTSTYGMAESVDYSKENTFGFNCFPTSNPIPFLEISERSIRRNLITRSSILEIATAKNNLSFVHNKLREYFLGA